MFFVSFQLCRSWRGRSEQERLQALCFSGNGKVKKRIYFRVPKLCIYLRMPKFLAEKLLLFLLFCYFHLLFGDDVCQISSSRLFILPSNVSYAFRSVTDFLPIMTAKHLRGYRQRKKGSPLCSGLPCMLWEGLLKVLCHCQAPQGGIPKGNYLYFSRSSLVFSAPRFLAFSSICCILALFFFSP